MGEEIKHLASRWKHWRYKNTALLLTSLLLFFWFADSPVIKNTIGYIGGFGYIGAFIAGILFVSIFTVAPASVILFFLADSLNPLAIAICAGIGAVVGDYLIFKYLKDRVFQELEPIFVKNGGTEFIKLFKTPYFAWIIPLIGAVIIASPFPDEVGIGMMGLSKIKAWQFVLVAFLLNSVGIFLVITTARSF